jgi:hypothetical protein
VIQLNGIANVNVLFWTKCNHPSNGLNIFLTLFKRIKITGEQKYSLKQQWAGMMCFIKYNSSSEQIFKKLNKNVNPCGGGTSHAHASNNFKEKNCPRDI